MQVNLFSHLASVYLANLLNNTFQLIYSIVFQTHNTTQLIQESSFSNHEGRVNGDKLKDQSDEMTPKILEQVAENWGKRCHNIGSTFVKYYHDPSSSTGKCQSCII